MHGEGGKLNGRRALKIAANIKIIYLVCKVLAIENKAMTKLSHTNLKLLPFVKVLRHFHTQACKPGPFIYLIISPYQLEPE